MGAKTTLTSCTSEMLVLYEPKFGKPIFDFVLFTSWENAASTTHRSGSKPIPIGIKKQIPSLFPQSRLILVSSVDPSIDGTLRAVCEATLVYPSIFLVMGTDSIRFSNFLMSSTTLLERVRAILFTDMKTNQVLGKPFLENLKRRSIFGIEVVDFRWVKKGFKIKEEKGKGYTCVELPGPVMNSSWKRKRKKENPEDYSWLNCLRVGPYSRVIDFMPKWKAESGNYFAQILIKVVDTIGASGRSVWFLVRPLQSIRLPGGLARLIPFSHWGILISPLTKRQMTNRMHGNHSNTSEEWGKLHELHRRGGQADYVRNRFFASDFQRATKLAYLGQTEMTDMQLYELGTAIIAENPIYDLFSDSCQDFVERFLRTACPTAEINYAAIGNLLRGSSK